MNREYNEHHLRFQLSERPFGIMETGHLDGHRLRRLGDRPGFGADLGYRCIDRSLNGSLRSRDSLPESQHWLAPRVAITVSTRIILRRNKTVSVQVFLAVNF